jgi:hypothetical protein
MPSSTPKQKRTMGAAAHNPAFAKKVGIPQSVAKKFNRADQGLPEFCKGGKVLSTKRM